MGGVYSHGEGLCLGRRESWPEKIMFINNTGNTGDVDSDVAGDVAGDFDGDYLHL